MNGNR
jgi:hypothetical protein